MVITVSALFLGNRPTMSATSQPRMQASAVPISAMKNIDRIPRIDVTAETGKPLVHSIIMAGIMASAENSTDIMYKEDILLRNSFPGGMGRDSSSSLSLALYSML